VRLRIHGGCEGPEEGRTVDLGAVDGSLERVEGRWKEHAGRVDRCRRDMDSAAADVDRPNCGKEASSRGMVVVLRRGVSGEQAPERADWKERRDCDSRKRQRHVGGTGTRCRSAPSRGCKAGTTGWTTMGRVLGRGWTGARARMAAIAGRLDGCFCLCLCPSPSRVLCMDLGNMREEGVNLEDGLERAAG
jgi:hypothetical protein